jgi:hypothetical protein
MTNDPIGAVGFLLQEFSAGLAGRELPSTRLKQEAVQRQQLEMQQIQVGSQVLKQGLELMERTPLEERQRMVDAFAGEFAESMPGMRDMLLELSENIPDAIGVASSVGEFGPQLYALCGSDTTCIRKHAADEGYMNQLRTHRDEQNMPILGAKMREITGVMHTNPGVLSGLPRDASGNFVMTFADIGRLNTMLPDDLKLTGSEMNTLQRNHSVMAAFGIKTPELINEEQKALARARIDRQFSPPKMMEIERDGQKLQVGVDAFSGRELFSFPAGKVEPGKFDGPAFKAALALRAAGEELPEGAFSDAITETVGNMEPDAAANVKAGLGSGGMQVTTHPDGSTEITFGAGDQTAAKAEQRVLGTERGKSRIAAAQFGSDIANIGNVLIRAHTLGEGATGLRAAVMDGVGGYLDQYSPGSSGKLGTLIDQVAGGKTASAEEIAAFRAQAQVAIAQNITTISGEESGRFTEAERNITQEVTKLVETGASKVQVVSAMSELLKLKIMLREFSQIKAGIPSRWDFSDRSSQDKFITEMTNLGLSDTMQKDLVKRLIELREQTAGIFGG